MIARIFLHGPGGSGKTYMLTRVILPVYEHFLPKASKGIAAQNSAARLITGATVHYMSALKRSAELGLQKPSRDRMQALERRWQHVALAFLDEISLTPPSLLAVLDDAAHWGRQSLLNSCSSGSVPVGGSIPAPRALGKRKTRRSREADDAFAAGPDTLGNILCQILAGDFLQLNPVLNHSLMEIFGVEVPRAPAYERMDEQSRQRKQQIDRRGLQIFDRFLPQTILQPSFQSRWPSGSDPGEHAKRRFPPTDSWTQRFDTQAIVAPEQTILVLIAILLCVTVTVGQWAQRVFLPMVCFQQSIGIKWPASSISLSTNRRGAALVYMLSRTRWMVARYSLSDTFHLLWDAPSSVGLANVCKVLLRYWNRFCLPKGRCFIMCRQLIWCIRRNTSLIKVYCESACPLPIWLRRRAIWWPCTFARWTSREDHQKVDGTRARARMPCRDRCDPCSSGRKMRYSRLPTWLVTTTTWTPVLDRRNLPIGLLACKHHHSSWRSRRRLHWWRLAWHLAFGSLRRRISLANSSPWGNLLGCHSSTISIGTVDGRNIQ